MNQKKIIFTDDLIIGFGKFKNNKIEDVPWALNYLLEIDPDNLHIINNRILVKKMMFL